MKILMIAPEPFFQPRGTPFSEYYRIKCLSELGHTIDLATYHIGENVEIPRLRIFRIKPIPGIKDVKIGPSITKIPLDLMLFSLAWRMAATGNYDVIHSHEEGGAMGVFLSKLYSLPHVYDMHSSLPQQMTTFRFTNSKLIKMAFGWLESNMLGAADAVIAICPALVETVKKIEPRANVALIENTADSSNVDSVSAAELSALRKKLNLKGQKVVMYIGTFETYQGLGMLLEAGVKVIEQNRKIVFVLVGGKPEQVEKVKKKATGLGIDSFCSFTGMVAHEQVPAYMKLADVLVSPRRFGTNTPLKIYSYLRSGKPIVATDLQTHTQVLNHEVAVLVPANAEHLAQGIDKVLENESLAARLAKAARHLSEEKYSYRHYLEKTKAVYAHIGKLINGRR